MKQAMLVEDWARRLSELRREFEAHCRRAPPLRVLGKLLFSRRDEILDERAAAALMKRVPKIPSRKLSKSRAVCLGRTVARRSAVTRFGQSAAVWPRCSSTA